MPVELTRSAQWGELSAGISAADLSLPLEAGQGARFESFAGGGHLWALVVDQTSGDYTSRYEWVKLDGRSTDTLNVASGGRGLFGTTARTFPAGAKVSVADGRPNLLALLDGGAIIQATAPTLNALSARNVILTPAGAITLDLPQTDVWAGREFRIADLSGTHANTITIRAADASVICVLPGGRNIVLIADQDDPATAADWRCPRTWFDEEFLVTLAGGAKHKMAGAVNVGLNAEIAYALPENTLNRDGEVIQSLVANSLAGIHVGFGSSEFRHPKMRLVEQIVLRDGSSSQKIASLAHATGDGTGETGRAQVGSGTNATTSPNNIIAASWRRLGPATHIDRSTQFADMARMSASRIAWADANNDEVRAYDFDGESFSLAGSAFPFTIGAGDDMAMCALSPSRIVIIGNVAGGLRVLQALDFNGSTWSTVGNQSSTLGDWSTVDICALSASRFVVAKENNANGDLRVQAYDFDGMNFSVAGNEFLASDGASSGSVACAPLSSSRIAVYMGSFLNLLRTLDFDGSDWSQTGNAKEITEKAAMEMVALSSTRIVTVDGTTDTFRVWDFDGSDWTERYTGAAPYSAVSQSAMCELSSERLAFHESFNDDLIAYELRPELRVESQFA